MQMFNEDGQELLAKLFLPFVSEYLWSNYSVIGIMVLVHVFNKTDMVLFLMGLPF